MEDCAQVLYDLEVHDAQGLNRYFETSGNVNEVHAGLPLFTTRMQMCLRPPRFRECVRALIG